MLGLSGSSPDPEIPLYRFLDDGETFLSKSGDCGVLLESSGVDPDCMDRKQIDRITERIEDAFAVFDHRTLLHEIYFRRRVEELPATPCGSAALDEAERSRTASLTAGGLYEESLYYSILYLDPRAERNLWQAFRSKQLGSYFQRRKFQKLLISEVEESIEKLRHKRKSSCCSCATS
jgi:hypothetical protein